MEAKLKHLEFIQAVINRMAGNSSMFKGWAVTLAAALSAFAAVNTKVALLVIAVSSTAVFWGLDAYYLWLERCFITLHGVVAGKPNDEIDFSMAIDKSHPICEWRRAFFRLHLVFFYGAIVLVDVVAIFLIKK